ncbi:MAG: cytochrome C oxidase subunit II [Deltaproteobacteria bacterium]|jgi:tetratricopeptide (TPR) repeat protein|nr:cytochrome C oxidase subunit II [Deltaproteobacteria bacterium]MBT6614985.1 cytochrome C oxidase subunit II [Deltaproteobacteria bacterium]
MARETIVKSPNLVHPEKPSAVGSRNSLHRQDRDEYEEAKGIIDEEVDKILNHIHAKLPPEVLEKLDVMGSVKSKLHNYFNQDFQNMLNRYLVTMEDEMNKKIRDLIDKEETRTLNKYTPREITEIITRIGDSETFNTEDIEKSVVNMYSHLQGHIERGVAELETNTNALLREKTDVGVFIRGENSYAIEKCTFKDNSRRPKTVMDLKLSISILDSELISRIYHYQVPVTSIIKDIVAKNIHELIDKEIDEINQQLVDEGKEEMSDSERIFEKLRVMDKYISDDNTEESKRYQFVAKKFLDSVDGIQAEIESKDYNSLNIRENIKKIIDNENIRNRGFNTAVNSITSILDNSKMGYQFIENYKNARECIIREYEEEDVTKLPDERYNLRLVYYDQKQLKSLRKAYSKQIEEMEREVMHLWKVCHGVYTNDRDEKEYDDWETLADRMLKPKKKKGFFRSKSKDEPEIEEKKPLWNEISYIQPKDTIVSKSNPTEEARLDEIAARFPLMSEKLQKVYSDQIDETRQILDARLNFLQEQFEEFMNQINPYHVQPGLLLDIDIISIKKKKTTMMNMANVINEFLYSVSKGFSDTIVDEQSVINGNETQENQYVGLHE